MASTKQTAARAGTIPAVEDPEVKTRQRAMWGLGNYHKFATELIWNFRPELVEACGISPGQRVLDVAAGSGNVAIGSSTPSATFSVVGATNAAISAYIQGGAMTGNGANGSNIVSGGERAVRG